MQGSARHHPVPGAGAVAQNEPMDENRYGTTPRWKVLAFGLPVAILLTAAGIYLSLVSWGVVGDEESTGLSVLGPLVAGFGVALGWVVVRPRP